MSDLIALEIARARAEEAAARARRETLEAELARMQTGAPARPSTTKPPRRKPVRPAPAVQLSDTDRAQGIRLARQFGVAIGGAS